MPIEQSRAVAVRAPRPKLEQRIESAAVLRCQRCGEFDEYLPIRASGGLRRDQFQHSDRWYHQPTNPDLLDRALHQHDPLDRLQRRGDEPGDELAEVRSGEESQPQSLDGLLLVFPPRLVAARVLIPERRRGFQLRRHHREECRRWRLAARQDTARKPEVAKLDSNAQPVVVPTMLANEREIAPAQGVMADLIGLDHGDREQRLTFGRGQQFPSRQGLPCRCLGRLVWAITKDYYHSEAHGGGR